MSYDPMQDIESLRKANVILFQRLDKESIEKRDLRKTLAEALSRVEGILAVLTPLAETYTAARDKAYQLKTQNDAASTSSKGASGTGHHTPAEVIDAVAEWKHAAIKLAEAAKDQVIR